MQKKTSDSVKPGYKQIHPLSRPLWARRGTFGRTIGPVRSENAGRTLLHFGSRALASAGWRVRLARPLSGPTSSTGFLFGFGGRTAASRRQWVRLCSWRFQLRRRRRSTLDRRRLPTIQQRAWGLPLRPVAAPRRPRQE